MLNSISSVFTFCVQILLRSIFAFYLFAVNKIIPRRALESLSMINSLVSISTGECRFSTAKVEKLIYFSEANEILQPPSTIDRLQTSAEILYGNLLPHLRWWCFCCTHKHARPTMASTSISGAVLLLLTSMPPTSRKATRLNNMTLLINIFQFPVHRPAVSSLFL